LSPWDIAAGSLMITEAGGLIGNFTGEADFLYQREVVAGNPKIYGQLVQTLAPYTRVIKADASASGARAAAAQGESAPSGIELSPESALSAALGVGDVAAAGTAPEAAPEKKKAVRIRKADITPKDDAPF
jgi:myo-inositol-1(or 4)-monophosphatase